VQNDPTPSVDTATVRGTRAVSSAGRAPALQAGGRRFDPVTAHVEAAHVSLLRWLRRQLRQPSPIREHLEAAVENDDPAEARRLLAQLPFNDAQRRNVEQLLEAWERTLGRGAGSSVGRAGDF
jgi:hypothetical protein